MEKRGTLLVANAKQAVRPEKKAYQAQRAGSSQNEKRYVEMRDASGTSGKSIDAG